MPRSARGADAATFSLHPLKNLNVWGDGGMVATRSADLADRLRRYRNHGLIDRDHVATFGVNSRLDALQAVVGSRLLRETDRITEQRIANARRYDEALSELEPDVRVPVRRPGVRHVFHLYAIRAERRDELLVYLGRGGRGEDPLSGSRTPAARGRRARVRRGDFPSSEADAGGS